MALDVLRGHGVGEDRREELDSFGWLRHLPLDEGLPLSTALPRGFFQLSFEGLLQPDKTFVLLRILEGGGERTMRGDRAGSVEDAGSVNSGLFFRHLRHWWSPFRSVRGGFGRS